MKIKKILLLFLSAVMVFSFCGCDMISDLMGIGTPEPDGPVNMPEVPEVLEPIDPNWPVSVFGTEIEKAPEKVAVFSPSLAEYIFDMGLNEKIVAVPDYCGFSGASSYPTVGSVRLPDMEAVKEASPEYILSFTEFEESILIEFQQMNVTVITIKAPQNLEELKALYEEIAFFFKGAIDGETFGTNYVSEYLTALGAMKYSGEEQKSIAFIRGLDYMMITSGTLEQDLFNHVGIKNAAEDHFNYTFPEEHWKEFDPDVIFLNPDLHLIDLETSDLYKKKSAVKGDRVYNADMDAIAIGSMRSFEILKDVLATVYEDYTGGTPYEPAYPSLYKQ